MNDKYSLGSINNNFKIIGLIFITCILVIAILYYFKNSINENFNSDAATINNDEGFIKKTEENIGENNDKYSGRLTLRNCQVYFVGEDEKEECDKIYNTDPLNTTCKYEFKDGWKEIDTVKDKNNDLHFNKIPNKIYNKDNGNINNIENQRYMTACYKDRDSENTMFKYQENEHVIYENGGEIDDNTSLNNTLRLNVENNAGVFEEKKYISKFFKDSASSKANNNNILNSICSIKYNNIVHLIENKNFYKFKLKKLYDNWVLDNITNVTLTEDQNNFTFREVSTFAGDSSYGIYFAFTESNSVKFNVLKKSIIADKPVDVYRFKYNYLCNGRILEYKININDKILMNNLIASARNNYIETSNYKVSLTYDIKILPPDFWNHDDFRNESETLLNMVNNIKNKIDTKRIDILNDLDKNPDYSDASVVSLITAYDNNIQESNGKIDIFHDTVSITDKEENIVKKPIIGLTKNSTGDILFNYDRGFYMETLTQEGPYINNVNSKINEITVNASSLDDIKFGAPGLNLFYKYNYYWNRRTYFDNATALPQVITDFAGIVAMSGNQAKYNNNRQEHYSFKWTGKIYARKSELYRFHTYSDDASHLYINNRLVVNNGGLHGGHWRAGDIHLVKGQIYDIEVNFGEYTGGDTIHVDWGELNNYRNTQTRTINQRNIGTSEPWIYTSITGTGNTVHYANKNWTYENGEFFLNIRKDKNAKPITQSTIDIDGIKIILNDNGESWIPIISHINYNKYNFFYGRQSDGNVIYLKAVQTQELTNEIIKSTTNISMSNRNIFNNYNTYYNVSADNVKLNTSWNKTIKAYTLENIIVSGFVFLQKGTYSLGAGFELFTSSIIYQESILTIKDIFNNEITIVKSSVIFITDEFTIVNGGFYMFSYSCLLLLNRTNDLKFAFIGKYKHNNKDTRIYLYDYVYNGNKIYDIYMNNSLKNIFKDLLFVGNTSESMQLIKDYLKTEHDYWDIGKYNRLKEIEENKKRDINKKKSDRILAINTEINRIKSLFDNFDFSGLYETSQINMWFDTPKPEIKPDLNPQSIFANFSEVDYITYEKKANINDRTPTISDNSTGFVGSKFTTNFKDINDYERSIYVLRS